MEGDDAKRVGRCLHACANDGLHLVAETCFCLLEIWQVLGLEELICDRLVGFFLNGRAGFC